MSGDQTGARKPATREAAVPSPAAVPDDITTTDRAAWLEIQVNGEPRRCRFGLSLVQVLEALGYRPQLVVVEFNGEILPRQRWAAQAVVESDVLEVVTIVGGGS